MRQTFRWPKICYIIIDYYKWLAPVIAISLLVGVTDPYFDLF